MLGKRANNGSSPLTRLGIRIKPEHIETKPSCNPHQIFRPVRKPAWQCPSNIKCTALNIRFIEVTDEIDCSQYHFKLPYWPHKPCKSCPPTRNLRKTSSDERFQLKDRNFTLNSNVFLLGWLVLRSMPSLKMLSWCWILWANWASTYEGRKRSDTWMMHILVLRLDILVCSYWNAMCRWGEGD